MDPEIAQYLSVLATLAITGPVGMLVYLQEEGPLRFLGLAIAIVPLGAFALAMRKRARGAA